MKHDIYQVNAFTDRQFGGNPAAVVPLEEWLPDGVMQAVAAENNLSETAFYVPATGAVPAEGEGAVPAKGAVPASSTFGLRWFTPKVEVDLCGHATLATAHVLFNELGHGGDSLRFDTRSGELRVQRAKAELQMDFPVYPVAEAPLDEATAAALGGTPEAAFESSFWLYLYGSEAEVGALAPDFRALHAAADRPVIATAPGDGVDGEADFVSRFFGPQVGVDEDPVTGSAHCALTPLWAARLGKQRLTARQISARGGELGCELAGERVILRGKAQTFLRGQIELR